MLLGGFSRYDSFKKNGVQMFAAVRNPNDPTSSIPTHRSVQTVIF
jgi:hypothetical protein